MLTSLEPHTYGWRTILPKVAAQFLGRSVGIDFQTRGLPRRSVPPKPKAAELAIARSILVELPRVLAVAEGRFKRYEKDPKARSLVCQPHIWIDRDTIEGEGTGRWCFVVGRVDGEDFGYHVEFDGLKVVEVWAGD